jgi:hypothetical protein
MKAAKKQRAEEPMGIVISGTTQPPQSTVFLAYEWSPAPTASEEEPKAA